MPSIIPFKECVARPGSFLQNHLINVRVSMEVFFEDYNIELTKVIGLAGICHDLAKSNIEWQDYINNNKKKGPNHSACGAFFFSYLAYEMLKEKEVWDDYNIYWLWLIRDIADHHGKLGHLSENGWLKSYTWNNFDLLGIQTFIHEQYPELKKILFNEEVLEDWIDDAGDIVEEVLDVLYIGYNRWEPLELMNKLQEWRMLTTSLISGDRFDVRNIETSWINKEKHIKYSKNIDKFCKGNQGHPLSKIRMESQINIKEQLEQNPNEYFYTLDMPTGYGKTITALKIATELGQKQGYKKILYVAPYLSILEQTSKTIEEAMKTRVLEHHSLAILNSDENNENQLWMEAWSHAIVCTSFNQFFKAIFPRRGQDTLRRTFLKDTIIIIDEPQIFNPDIWNLFLCGLESLSLLLNIKVFFLSATMPPFKYGLLTEPTKLKIEALSDYNRYNLYIEDDKDEYSLAQFLEKNETTSQAAILNTIEDAYRVYQNIGQKKVYMLHGLMVPIHKNVVIGKIKRDLETIKEPLYLVSTQVIEAGVDLSFQHIARALPVLPSIVQTAGRVNRHNEGDKKGIISTFPFYRSSEIDTRTYIYPRPLQKITDQLLDKKSSWTEIELTKLVQEYYEKMFKQNTYETSLSYIKDAYEGDWESLSEFEPFQEDYLKLPIFIPWNPKEDDKKYLNNKFVFLQEKFQIKNSYEIYERYEDLKYMSSLSFEDRKQFMILFNYHILNLPVKKALQIASKEDFLSYKIPILLDTYAYDQDIGLKSIFEEYDNFI